MERRRAGTLATPSIRRAAACLLIGSCAVLSGMVVASRPALASTPRDPSFSALAQHQATTQLAKLGGATFAPDDLVTDINFTAIDSLSEPAIESFLSAQPGVLDSYQAADHSGVKRSAAAIIYQAARAWVVSPKVILVTLQKEQGLLSATSPSASALAWAMGCGVPDSGLRDATYQGFGNQVWYGAESLHNDGQEWSAGITKVCGDGTVKPADRASYALYTYTPWIGLAGGGNKLFWTLYWQYFGNPLAVDSTPPTTSVSGTDALWHAKAVTLSLSAADNPGGTGVAYTQYSLDGGPWVKATKLTVIAPATHADDGIHTVRYRSADDAGNLEKAKSCTVKIDTTPPTTRVSGVDDLWHNKAVTLSFHAVDGRSGIATTESSLDHGVTWTKGTSVTIPAAADHSGDGTTKVLYRSVDNAGNTEAAHSCNVNIDTRPPRPIANWAASVTTGHTASLRCYVSDPRPGSPSATVTIRVRTPAGRLVRKLTLRGVAVNERLSATFRCRLSAGHYRFYVYATDAAGNSQSQVASNRLTVR